MNYEWDNSNGSGQRLFNYEWDNSNGIDDEILALKMIPIECAYIPTDYK